MRLVRRLFALDEPQEARFFLFLAAFGIVVAIVYWFASYEIAGTILLLGFGIAPGVIGLRLSIDPAARAVRARRRDGRVTGRAAAGAPDLRDASDLRPGREDVPGGGTGGVDRPYLDEAGRLPAPTYAPFAVGLGVAAIATAAIFGPAPLIVGILPVAWGAWRWLAGASDEFDAVDAAPPVTGLQPGTDGRSGPSDPRVGDSRVSVVTDRPRPRR